MEDTLRDLIKGSELGAYKSLNPCFNGRYSQSDILQEDVASGQES